MELRLIPEPELEFGGEQRHVDIRFGLMQSGPLDIGGVRVPKPIKLGLVGTPDEVEALAKWLEKCRAGLPAKESKLPNLFPRFPGFASDGPFGTELSIDRELTATVDPRDVRALVAAPRDRAALERAVQLFGERCDYLEERSKPDVFMCAPPSDLLEAFDAELPEDAEEMASSQAVTDRPIPHVFHDVLKARLLRLRRPIQMVRPETYGRGQRRSVRKRGRGSAVVTRGLQDEATRAWNLHVALYYKAGGTPWRIARDPADFATCYVGISFYRSLDQEQLYTSMAQVFNERGDGVIVRGGPARYDKEDRRPKLDEADAAALLRRALTTYRREHGNLPARVVIHKTSEHDPGERRGFHMAASEERIEMLDLVSLFSADTRLLRHAYYPPLRGTLLGFTPQVHLLYLRGSVNFYETWPGMYVPHPIGLRLDDVQSGAVALAEEILALSKQNWNNTQFDGGWPITIRASRQVGGILKHVGGNDPVPAAYAYYM